MNDKPSHLAAVPSGTTVTESPLGRVKFDDYELDLDNEQLYLKGTRVNIEKRMLKLLVLLIRRRPEAVGKQELMDTLWPNQTVSDWSLSRLVSDTRRLLGDSGKAQAMIGTFRGEGFCFNAAVSEVPQGDEPVQTSSTAEPKKKRSNGLVALIVLAIILTIVGVFTWKVLSSRYPSESDAAAQAAANAQARYLLPMEQLERNLTLTKTAFRAQVNRRTELATLLAERVTVPEDPSWEVLFATHYDSMTTQERFVFDQIRAITEGPLYEGNSNLLATLDAHPELAQVLPSYLSLRNHLTFWLNKYQRVFVPRPELALVYAGEADGVPFPSQVDDEVAQWLKSYQERAAAVR